MQSYLWSLMYLLMIVTLASVTLASPRPDHYIKQTVSTTVTKSISVTGQIRARNNRDMFVNPLNEITNSSQNKLASSGSPVELFCTANAEPSSQIFWLYGTDEHVNTQLEKVSTYIRDIRDSSYWRNRSIVTSTLIIHCSQPEHEGSVVCASVSKTKIEPKELYLTVGDTGKPCLRTETVPSIIFHADKVFALPNTTVTLPCRLTGREIPSYFWFNERNERIVPTTNNKYTILSNGDLQITNFQRSDMGQYICKISSSYLERDIKITLFYEEE